MDIKKWVKSKPNHAKVIGFIGGEAMFFMVNI